jgi:hypothetical protein
VPAKRLAAQFVMIPWELRPRENTLGYAPRLRQNRNDEDKAIVFDKSLTLQIEARDRQVRRTISHSIKRRAPSL